MIDVNYVAMMARYNTWQNTSVYDAADTLSDDARHLDRGAFFKSIHETLCHIFWGDQIWMHRFAGTRKPEFVISDSASMVADWNALKVERVAFDEVIENWSESLDPEWLTGKLSWFSGAAGRDMSAPISLLVTHMFNHQTHHRGQVHAMLTNASAYPDDTDLMLMAIR